MYGEDLDTAGKSGVLRNSRPTFGTIRVLFRSGDKALSVTSWYHDVSHVEYI